MAKDKQRNTQDNQLDVILCNDTPTKYAHLGWRIICTFLSWCLLGKGIEVGNAFFAAQAVFILPLLLDYYKYTPKSGFRTYIMLVAKIINWLFLICAILGLIGIITVVKENTALIIQTTETFIFPNMNIINVQRLWLSMISLVAICVIDWVANNTTLENSIINNNKEGCV